MKRRDLVRRIEAVGFRLDRASGPHDVYAKPGRKNVMIPRHKEIKEHLAQAILRDAGA